MTTGEGAPIRAVLWGTDFSPTAELALAHAEALARRHGSTLVLVHVIEPWPTTPYPPITVADEAERSLREAATKRLEAIRAPLERAGLDVTARVLVGGPGHETVELARSIGADLVVVGTHGRTGLAHLVYGSTAEYIVRRSPVPVLTVHPGDPRPHGRPQTILLPTDLSRGAEEALAAAIRLHPALQPTRKPAQGEGRKGEAAAEAPGATRLVLLHVDEVARYFEPYGEEVIPAYFEFEGRRQELEGKLDAVAARLRDRGFEVAARVTSGTPVPVICDVAREEQADLIALGTHGHSAVVNLLMGRTAQRVVQHAPCPVLTVRTAEEPPGGSIA